MPEKSETTKTTNKRKVGGQYEQLAADYIRGHGGRVLSMNYRCRFGEIDLIAKDGPYLVFAEVKYRSNLAKGAPAEAVNYYKQQRIRQTARFYLYAHRYPENTLCRFDVVSILADEITWIRNAF